MSVDKNHIVRLAVYKKGYNTSKYTLRTYLSWIHK